MNLSRRGREVIWRIVQIEWVDSADLGRRETSYLWHPYHSAAVAVASVCSWCNEVETAMVAMVPPPPPLLLIMVRIYGQE